MSGSTKGTYVLQKYFKQESIPVGCVPSAAVTVVGGASFREGGVLPGDVCASQEVSTGGGGLHMGYLPRGCLPRGCASRCVLPRVCLPGGGVCPGGICPWGDVCPMGCLSGGVCPEGFIPACTEADTSPP